MICCHLWASQSISIDSSILKFAICKIMTVKISAETAGFSVIILQSHWICNWICNGVRSCWIQWVNGAIGFIATIPGIMVLDGNVIGSIGTIRSNGITLWLHCTKWIRGAIWYTVTTRYSGIIKLLRQSHWYYWVIYLLYLFSVWNNDVIWPRPLILILVLVINWNNCSKYNGTIWFNGASGSNEAIGSNVTIGSIALN